VSSSFGQFGAMLGAAVIGGALGDVVWFMCGKRYGTRALHWVSKLLPGRQTGIVHMERFFERYGVRVLVIARFLPGLSLVSVPLCGAVAVRWRSFVLHDCAGLGLWAATTLAVGAMFASQVDHTAALRCSGTFAGRCWWPSRWCSRCICPIAICGASCGKECAQEPQSPSRPHLCRRARRSCCPPLPVRRAQHIN
jgi:uncharacterized membrane protein YdjX (TVP38/TMEM64 family)